MPGQVCAVVTCKSNRLQLKKRGSSITFHSFPKTINAVSSSVRKEWILRCGRDKFNANTARICSLHFTDDDYERDLQHELLGLPLRRTLKKTAVPSQNLSIGLENENHQCNQTHPTKQLVKRSKKQSILTETKTQQSVTEEQETTDMNASSVIYCLDIPSTSENTTIFTIIQDENQPNTPFNTGIDYKQKYEDLLVQFNQSREEVTRLKKSAKYYKMQLYLHSLLTKNDKLTMAEKLLNRVLTKNQISLFSKKKKRICGNSRKSNNN